MKIRLSKLNLKICLSILTVVVIFSGIHLFSQVKLLGTIQKDAENNAAERLSSSAARLDARFNQLLNEYVSLSQTPSFRNIARMQEPSAWAVTDLDHQLSINLKSNNLIEHYVLLLDDSDLVISDFGVFQSEEFFTQKFVSDRYGDVFWQSEKQAAFAIRCYEAAEFRRFSAMESYPSQTLLPVSFKSFFLGKITVVFFVDPYSFLNEVDEYFSDDFYIFNAEGEIAVSTDAQNRLLGIDDLKNIPDTVGDSFLFQIPSEFCDLTYAKIIDRNIVLDEVRGDAYFSMITLIAAVLVGIIVTSVEIIRITKPVKKIMNMLPDNTQEKTVLVDEFQYIQTCIADVIDQQEQYARQIESKNAELTKFLFQAKLKNIIVESDHKSTCASERDTQIFLLYIEIHYLNQVRMDINCGPQMVSYLFKEILENELIKRFGSVLIFQAEVNHFVARIHTSGASREKISVKIFELMNRLENEKEYAFFTIVQSELMQSEENITEIYAQMRQAAQYTIVNNSTQLIRIPVDPGDHGSYAFSAAQAHQLSKLVAEGDAEQAQTLARDILHYNLNTGICRIQMQLLCSSVMSVAYRTVSELYSENIISGLGGGNIYENLSCCDTDRDFIEFTCEFIRKAAVCMQDSVESADHIMDGIRAFLSENYQREFSLDELADSLHRSKNYLSGYFKKKTGTSLSTHIQNYRIQKALDLLRDPSLKIQDISTMVGIGNINTFLRQFKRYTGMTPSEYRDCEDPYSSKANE